MLKDIDVARYFIEKDKEHKLFTKNVIERNGRKLYDGNARLNKYLHLAQNIYIAKTGAPLMQAEFYAYDNGAVSTRVQENYTILLDKKYSGDLTISNGEKDFLDRFYNAFESADLDELIELSHEDPEWIENSRYYLKQDQKMDSMKRIEEYRKQYSDIVRILDRM